MVKPNEEIEKMPAEDRRTEFSSTDDEAELREAMRAAKRPRTLKKPAAASDGLPLPLSGTLGICKAPPLPRASAFPYRGARRVIYMDVPASRFKVKTGPHKFVSFCWRGVGEMKAWEKAWEASNAC